MLRQLVRLEMVEAGATVNQLREYDALIEEQFELWFKSCYEGPLAAAFPDYK